MKITKEQLLYMFAELGAIYEGTPTGTLYGHALYDALKNDNLEIDGFERVEWTKFDPNDESTFPPCEGVYLVCRGVEPYFMEAKFCGEKVGFGDTCVILWRPLPKPPTETEVQK